MVGRVLLMMAWRSARTAATSTSARGKPCAGWGRCRQGRQRDKVAMPAALQLMEHSFISGIDILVKYRGNCAAAQLPSPPPPPPHLRVDERRVHPHTRRLQPGAAHGNVGFQGGPLVAQALQLRLQGRGVAHWSVGGARGGCVPGLAIRMGSADRVIAAGCAASGCRPLEAVLCISGPHAGAGLAGSCCRSQHRLLPSTICRLAHPAMRATAGERPGLACTAWACCHPCHGFTAPMNRSPTSQQRPPPCRRPRRAPPRGALLLGEPRPAFCSQPWPAPSPALLPGLEFAVIVSPNDNKVSCVHLRPPAASLGGTELLSSSRQHVCRFSAAGRLAQSLGAAAAMPQQASHRCCCHIPQPLHFSLAGCHRSTTSDWRRTASLHQRGCMTSGKRLRRFVSTAQQRVGQGCRSAGPECHAMQYSDCVRRAAATCAHMR